MDQFGLIVRIGSDWIGLGWIRLHWIGSDCVNGSNVAWCNAAAAAAAAAAATTTTTYDHPFKWFKLV